VRTPRQPARHARSSLRFAVRSSAAA